MADKKISELDAITGANTAATDAFVVVDTSTGQTKKITREELNNAIEQDVLSTVDINGGTIDGTTIGATTPAAGSFTTVGATGNITVGGTVDGRDVATDGTKLDGIEASATADQTGAEIATALNGQTISSLTALTTTGAVIVGGDFTVNGTTTTINSTTLEVDDKNIVLASGAADAAAANGSGITIDGASATFTYVSSGDKWQLNKPLDVGGDVTFGDNEKAIFGASNDLEILHDGTNSTIRDNGSGNLSLTTNGAKIGFYDQANNQFLAEAFTGAGFRLYYDGSQKFVTQPNGIDVTGTVTADGLTVDTDTLHVDSTNNRVGIGTNSPTAPLMVNGGGINFPIVVNSTDQYAGIAFADNTTTSNAHVAVYADGNELGFEAGNAERMRIDSSGNVGIGTTTPSQKLDVSGAGARIYLNDANEDIDMNSTADGQLRLDGSGYAGAIALNTDGMNIYTNASSRNILFGVNETERMRLENDGDLHVDGNVVAYSTTISDIRLKKDIAPIEDAVTKVQQLNGCTFTYLKDDRKSAGLIAQDVEKVLPSAVIEDEAVFHGEEGETYKTVQYDQLIGLLVEAVKELKAEIEELKDASSK